MIRKTALFLLICFFAFFAKAQQSAYVQYNTDDGLAQSQVRAIGQDGNGYIWFGTVGGLSRFDGYEFLNFSTDDGLPANQINCLLRGESNFWIGSTGSLCKKTGLGFTTIPLPADYSSSKIFDMAEDRKGNLWLAFTGMGVLKFNGDTFERFDTGAGLPNGYIRTIETAPNGDIWVGGREGVVVISGDTARALPYADLSGPSVSDIRFLQDNSVVICTFGFGVFIIKDGEVKQFTQNSGLPSNHIRCVAELPNGELWVGSREGLGRYHKGAFETYGEAEGLPYSNVKSLGTDRQGNLWVGTDGQGVLMQAGRSFTSYSTQDGLHSDLVMDICETDTGSMLFGSYDNGLALFDGSDFSPYPYNDELPNNTTWVLNSDASGTIWAGTSQGLFRESNGRTAVINEQSGLPGNRVTALARGDRGWWVGAENGFALIDTSGSILETFSDSTGFSGKRIRSIITTKAGLWIGAQGSVYSYSGGNFDKIELDPKEEKPVYCLAEDAFAHIWIGTSSGLFVLNPGSSDLREVEIGSRFSSRNINFLTALPDSTLLIGTNNGLYRLQVDAFHTGGALRTKHYTNYEGLRSSETNQNAVFFDGHSVWFGTTSGAVKFDPYRDPFSSQVPPALNLSKVQLFLQDADWSKWADSVSVKSGLPQDLTLPFNQNYLTFYYAGIYLSNPEKVKYRYKLEGADADYLGPTRNRSVTYASLPHGDYVFRLEAFSEDEPGMVSSLAFPFTITPPFYLTPWFFVLVGFVILGLFYAIYTARIRKEHQKRATLRLGFQSRLMELESQSLNSSMNRHFIFNALNSIQYYINMQDRKAANLYLTSFAKLIRKNLDSSQKNETTLSDELSRLELYLSLEQMRFQGRFDYTIEVDPGLDTDQIEIPSMMLQPFLENSIWHGILPTEEHGEINVRIGKNEAGVTIEIIDNGIGVETSLARKAPESNGHISKGMTITQNRIDLYRKMTGLSYGVSGPEEIKDADGGALGTSVKITVPGKKLSEIEEF